MSDPDTHPYMFPDDLPLPTNNVYAQRGKKKGEKVGAKQEMGNFSKICLLAMATTLLSANYLATVQAFVLPSRYDT